MSLKYFLVSSLKSFGCLKEVVCFCAKKAGDELFGSLSLPVKIVVLLELPQPLGRVPPRALQHQAPFDINSRTTGSRTWNEQFSRLAVEILQILLFYGFTANAIFTDSADKSRNHAEAPAVARCQASLAPLPVGSSPPTEPGQSAPNSYIPLPLSLKPLDLRTCHIC